MKIGSGIRIRMLTIRPQQCTSEWKKSHYDWAL